jgi:hypothetical protein
MKLFEKGLSRRGILKRLGFAALIAPVAGLSKVVEQFDRHKRRRNRAELDIDDIWIGHC